MSSVRTQVYLTEEQKVRLERLAARQHTSMASLIRDAIDQFLKRGYELAEDPLDYLVGTAQAEPSVTSEEHDKYLYGTRR